MRFNLSIWNQVFSSVQTGLNTFDKVCKKSQLIGSSLGRSEAAYGLLWTHAAPCFFSPRLVSVHTPRLLGKHIIQIYWLQLVPKKSEIGKAHSMQPLIDNFLLNELTTVTATTTDKRKNLHNIYKYNQILGIHKHAFQTLSTWGNLLSVFLFVSGPTVFLSTQCCVVGVRVQRVTSQVIHFIWLVV